MIRYVNVNSRYNICYTLFVILVVLLGDKILKKKIKTNNVIFLKNLDFQESYLTSYGYNIFISLL